MAWSGSQMLTLNLYEEAVPVMVMGTQVDLAIGMGTPNFQLSVEGTNWSHIKAVKFTSRNYVMYGRVERCEFDPPNSSYITGKIVRSVKTAGV